MSGQNPVGAGNQQPPILVNDISHLHQQAAEAANRCDTFLDSYRQYVGPVQDIHELQNVDQEPDLLSMRFAVIKAVRDDEASTAQDLAQRMVANGENRN